LEEKEELNIAAKGSQPDEKASRRKIIVAMIPTAIKRRRGVKRNTITMISCMMIIKGHTTKKN